MFIYNDKLVNEEKDITISIEDRGYQFGDGIYEVIRFYNGTPFMLEEHLDRLQQSADEIKLKWPCKRALLRENIMELIAEKGYSDGMVYLQMTRGNAPRNHLFPKGSTSVLTGYAKELARPLDVMKEGVKAKLLDDIRWLRCDIKSLNLLGNVLLKQEASESGYAEAVLHRDGTVTEGSSTNVFIVINGRLVTHPATHLILNGITRQKIIELALETGISVSEKPFTIDMMNEAEEIFISSTTMEIVPVVQVDGTKVNSGKRGRVTKKLQEAFEKSISLLTV